MSVRFFAPGSRLCGLMLRTIPLAGMTRVIEAQDFRTWLRCRRLLTNNLPPMPILRGKRDENLPLGVGCYIGEEETALAFVRTPLPERDQTAQAAVGFTIRWKTQKA